MKHPAWLACLAAILPWAALAADDPADPAAAAPAPQYRSVFDAAPRTVEDRTVPWRQANDTVGQFRRGHADLLKWEQTHDAAPPAAPAASAPAAPAKP